MTERKIISLILVLLLFGASLQGCGKPRFEALVVSVSGDSVLVIPESDSPPSGSADLISFSVAGLGVSPEAGQIVSVEYDGAVMESYPGQVRASGVEIIGEAEALPIDNLTEIIWSPAPIYTETAKLYFGRGGRFSAIPELGRSYYGQYSVESIPSGAPGEATLTVKGTGNNDYNGSRGARIVAYNGTQYLFIGDKFYLAAEEVEDIFYIYVEYVGDGYILGGGRNNALEDYDFVIYCQNAGDFRVFNTVRVECDRKTMREVSEEYVYDDGGGTPVTFKAEMRVDDPISVRLSDWSAGEPTFDKPVIYLYPTSPTTVNVKLFFDGALNETIPKYPSGGWTVTAYPDGRLTAPDGGVYPYLFWEGAPDRLLEITEGFCVSGEDTESFLGDKLACLGLNASEAGEFIEYWLPRMAGNKYNLIQFQTGEYLDMARLEITPAPDSILRVFMSFRATGAYTGIPEQELTRFERHGFAVVEWGGCELPGVRQDG